MINDEILVQKVKNIKLCCRNTFLAILQQLSSGNEWEMCYVIISLNNKHKSGQAMQGMQLQVGLYVHDYFTLQIHSFKRFCFLLLRWVMLHCGDATAIHIPLPGFKQFDFFNMTHSYCIIS